MESKKVPFSQDFYQWHAYGQELTTGRIIKWILSVVGIALVSSLLTFPSVGLLLSLVVGPILVTLLLVAYFFWKQRGKNFGEILGVLEQWKSRVLIGYVARFVKDEYRKVMCFIEPRNRMSFRFPEGTAVINVDLGGLNPRTYAANGSIELKDCILEVTRHTNNGRPSKLFIGDHGGSQLVSRPLSSVLNAITAYIALSKAGKMDVFDLGEVLANRGFKSREIHAVPEEMDDEPAVVSLFPDMNDGIGMDIPELSRGPSPEQELWGDKPNMDMWGAR